jgi:3,4-dihydroxy 2-butanone 4-phosphate synthase / GTP cyclohydrolase II
MPLFARVEDAVHALLNGQIIIVADSEERENEGDFLAAAEKVTSETIHFMISEGRGQLCLPVVPELARRLHLRPMVPNRTPATPCFAIPVDHRLCTTGISPKERAFTIQMMVDASTQPADFVRPGHIFPLIARQGGVLERPGHTEATVDLVRLGGMTGAGVLCEICSRDGQNMANGEELLQIADRFGLTIITIDEVIRFRREAEARLRDIPQPKTAIRQRGRAATNGSNGHARARTFSLGKTRSGKPC